MYYKDLTVPNRIRKFFKNYLVHTKGIQAGKPFITLPWQDEIINDLYGTLCTDTKLRRYTRGLVLIPRKNGKLFPNDTPIPTPKGFINMGNLKVGDEVYAGDGSVTKITYITEDQYPECYKLTFSDNTDIIACGEHQWEIGAVNTGRSNGAKWPDGQSYEKFVTTTNWIKDNLHKGGTKGGKKQNNCFITIDHCIDGPDLDLPIDPYVLGAWLGDGTSADNDFTCADIEIIKRIEKTGLSVHRNTYRKYSYTIGWGQNENGKNIFRKTLADNNLINNKHIPPIYLRASKEQRVALLQGLMDTDGYISKKGQFQFVNKNINLAEGVFVLMRSLGIRCSPPTKFISSWRYKGEKKYSYAYEVMGRADDMQPPMFHLSRKRNRITHYKGKSFNKTKRVFITSVEPVGKRVGRCIQVEHKDHTYLAGKQYIKTHNSTTVAGLCLYELLFGEEGGEIYGVANSREQARVIFSAACDFIAKNKDLQSRLTVHKNSIYNKKARSIFKVLSREAVTAYGLNASFVVFDELFGAPDDELYKSLSTSMGARKEPLMLAISTAGFSKASFLYQMVEHGNRVNKGLDIDDTFYAKIYGMVDGDNWEDEALWYKVNPSLGHTIPIKFLRDEYAAAKSFSRFETSFKTLYLNAWLDYEKSWVGDIQWMACGEDCRIEDFRGETCYVGLDLSINTDLSSAAFCFFRNDKYYVFSYNFCPAERIRDRSRKDHVPYEVWVNEGHLIATPGDCTDYDYILQKFKDLSAMFNIKRIGIDKWNSSYLSTKLQNEGFEVVKFSQGFESMNSPTKSMERHILNKKLAHDKNPIMRWAMSNVILKIDAAGNVRPDKAKSRERIDPIVATIMATELCSIDTGDIKLAESVWT